MKTLQDIKKEVIQKLADHFIEDPAFETKLLIVHSLKISALDYALENNRIFNDSEYKELMALVELRAQRMPMSQIFGEKEFWSLTFKVTKDTLTPRPDSETLIEAALNKLDDNNKQYRILDLGTGTGCLLLTLLSERPNATGLGIDISEEALVVAKENAANLNLAARADFHLSNWTDNIENSEKFDLIISNPPYIGLDERETLPPEVVNYEPEMALFSGEDGLDDYKKLSQQLSAYLSSDGFILVEIGYRQSSAVKEIFTSAGFNQITKYKDLADRDRCLMIEF
ncbi:MAG: peptide chain release factor N(5)-glutamine methyltransferase [Alphaproteobacteria bacterium]|nr:peptide chain release factor N(5)-glutamine methyltransferase [Alphaproteobacteria bacterium]HPF46981.1 peptide chain release factor N(5)-glutamine methyltransferase [Emcibacteraceae bacterium]HRW28638.1 peptide chain release factor N(5)-glutamine methyltransferase [Emcibacteraceae bacterium]